MDAKTQAPNERDAARKFKGVWICAELWDHDGLSYAEKFLVAEIDSLCDKDKPCFASNEFLAKRLKIAPRYMNNMLAKLTADGFLHRLGFNGRSTLRCVSPEISSNPAAARQLIKKYSVHKNVKAKRRVHKNVKAEFTQELSLTSQKCEPEISSRETQKRNDDDQLKLHTQVAATPSVVLVASSWPNEDDEATEIAEKLTEKLKLSYDQSKTVQSYLNQGGKGYVLEKVALTRSKDLRNAGGFFIRALEKDYREPVTNTKPPAPPKKKRVEPKPQEPQTTDEERAKTSAKLREFIQTLRASR
jgi:hypothetical protein